MQRVEIRDLHKTYTEYADKIITICCWARTIRDSKNIAFVEINDGAFKSVQVVVERERVANYEEIVKQRVGASFAVTGKLILTPNAQQHFEISADKVEVLGESEADYPLQKKGHTMEFLRCLMQCLEYILLQLLQYTNSLMKETLFIFIHQLLQQTIVRAQEKCSKLQLLIQTELQAVAK